MSVHRTKTGWSVRWRQGSRNRSRTFKKADGFTRNDAITFDQGMRRKKKLGGIDPLSSERDFWGVVEEWWRGHANGLSEGTRTNQRNYLEARIRPRYEGHRLCDITAPEVKSFRTELEEQDVGPATQRKILYTLSAVFTYAQEMGYTTHNPVSVIKKPGAYRQRLIQPFPPERVEELREWFLARNDLESATMVSVLAYAGPRPAEAHSGLTWGDVGASTLILRGEKTKRDRTTRLLSPLAEDLEAWRAQGPRQIGPVFGWSRSKFNRWRRKDFRKATDAIGIEKTRPYDLRHAFATLLAAEGRDIGYIARQMGHSVPTAQRWYSHLIEDFDETQDAEERIYAARLSTHEETNSTTTTLEAM